jgi:RHS repeat-associated protein
VGGDTTYFSYNSRDLITRIDSTQAGFTPNEFDYNALGQRTRITESTGTTYFVWDGIRITHEHDGAGNVARRYTYGHSPIVGVSDLLDLQDLEAGGDPHYFYHFDQVGGVHRLTAENETTAQSLEFSPYGRILVDTGSAPNPFAFPATYVRPGDVDGLSVSPGRTYDARLGRFGQRDPEPSSSRENLCAWPGSEPVGTTDPTGRENPKNHPFGPNPKRLPLGKVFDALDKWLSIVNDVLDVYNLWKEGKDAEAHREAIARFIERVKEEGDRPVENFIPTLGGGWHVEMTRVHACHTDEVIAMTANAVEALRGIRAWLKRTGNPLKYGYYKALARLDRAIATKERQLRDFKAMGPFLMELECVVRPCDTRPPFWETLNRLVSRAENLTLTALQEYLAGYGRGLIGSGAEVGDLIDIASY